MVLRDKDNNADGDVTDAGERRHVTQDANFNITALADASGNVVERYEYDPYGQQTVLDANWTPDADNTSDHAFTHGHQGGQLDPDTGLIHFRHRDYSPTLGRWVQQDPLGYVDGVNYFAFVGSSPANRLDPTGLKLLIDSDYNLDFYHQVLQAFQDIIGDCADLNLRAVWRKTNESGRAIIPFVDWAEFTFTDEKPDCACNRCWLHLKAAIEHSRTISVQPWRNDFGPYNPEHTSAGVSFVQPEPQPKVLDADGVERDPGFAGVLWHETIGHGLWQFPHPEIPENTKSTRAPDSTYVDPSIRLENLARDCLRINGKIPTDRPDCAPYYYEQ